MFDDCLGLTTPMKSEALIHATKFPYRLGAPLSNSEQFAHRRGRRTDKSPLLDNRNWPKIHQNQRTRAGLCRNEGLRATGPAPNPSKRRWTNGTLYKAQSATHRSFTTPLPTDALTLSSAQVPARSLAIVPQSTTLPVLPRALSAPLSIMSNSLARATPATPSIKIPSGASQSYTPTSPVDSFPVLSIRSEHGWLGSFLDLLGFVPVAPAKPALHSAKKHGALGLFD